MNQLGFSWVERSHRDTGNTTKAASEGEIQLENLGVFSGLIHEGVLESIKLSNWQAIASSKQELAVLVFGCGLIWACEDITKKNRGPSK